MSATVEISVVGVGGFLMIGVVALWSLNHDFGKQPLWVTLLVCVIVAFGVSFFMAEAIRAIRP